MREPGMLQSMQSQRVGHDLVTEQKQQIIPRIVFLYLGICIYTIKDNLSQIFQVKMLLCSSFNCSVLQQKHESLFSQNHNYVKM